MANIIHDPADMQRTSEAARKEGKRIGVVPTMGCLHEGHLSLIRAARRRTEFVITTIFVNPTQFGPAEDFDRYPRDIGGDTSLATGAGADCIFAPEMRDVYPEGYSTYVQVERLGEALEGRSRPGHFRGVATIVAKLLNITKPHVAVFGQKDAQQVVIINRMLHDLNFNVELMIVPTVREQDGLAMSSRNSYLTPTQRREAPVLYQSLQLAEGLIAGGETSSATVLGAMQELITKHSSGVVDYVSIADGATLEELLECKVHRPILVSLAVRFGSTRLIDNIRIPV
jgi:pantoate--beta-alanine ligase